MTITQITCSSIRRATRKTRKETIVGCPRRDVDPDAALRGADPVWYYKAAGQLRLCKGMRVALLHRWGRWPKHTTAKVDKVGTAFVRLVATLKQRLGGGGATGEVLGGRLVMAQSIGGDLPRPLFAQAIFRAGEEIYNDHFKAGGATAGEAVRRREAEQEAEAARRAAGKRSKSSSNKW